MEKMTFKFDETLNTAYLELGKLALVVTETDENWSRYFVVSNTGIRKSFYDAYDFKGSINNDELQWLMQTAVAFFEMKRTRLEKSKAESETDLEEITE